jgi:hypothetical protein
MPERRQFLSSRSVVPLKPVKLGRLPRNLRAPGADVLLERCTHHHRVNPTQSQEGPSCGGNATANWWEWALRTDVPQDRLHDLIGNKIGTTAWQLDGDRFWAETRDALAGGGREDGLTMEQIARIPKVTGICRAAKIQRIGKDWSLRKAAYLRAPMVLGLATSEAWGEEGYYIRPILPNPFAGHAILGDGFYVRGGSGAFESVLNTWVPFGDHGHALLNSPYVSYCMVDFAVQWQRPPQWWEDLAWLEYVIQSKATA